MCHLPSVTGLSATARYTEEPIDNRYAINSPLRNEAYFALECRAHYPHYLVLRTDSILYTQVQRAAANNKDRFQIFALDIPTKDYITEFFSSFGSFYLHPPNETGLLKLAQVGKYLSHLYESGPSPRGREDGMKRTFAMSLLGLRVHDIVSPSSVREPGNNIERLLKFIEEIKATRNELKEVIRLMEKNIESQTK